MKRTDHATRDRGVTTTRIASATSPQLNPSAMQAAIVPGMVALLSHARLIAKNAVPAVQPHSNAWVTFTYVSFSASAFLVALGVFYLPIDLWMKDYLTRGIVMLVQTCVTLSKAVRDVQVYDGQRNIWSKATPVPGTPSTVAIPLLI